ncbi:MAG TPA: 3-oxoacyl-[acyl-carrier-protein] reductase [Candidatus Marinimicrobia bacterium]|nr:3-oxoacyl-[acyl-carrier-protein] reductase [Candidatus Neomarinimicrobiota bacterium]
MNINFQNKVVWVTGASRGIGRAIALAFAESGAIVIASARSEENLKKLSEIASGNIHTMALDVTNEAAITEKLACIIAQFKKVDILVNAAGITRDKLIMRMSNDDWDSVLETNLKSAFLLSRELSRPMMKARSGTIILISSVIGITGNAGQANYAASKAGIIALTKSLAKELAPRNIRVNCIAPGFIETDMTAGLSEEIKEKIVSGIALNRTGTADDLTGAVRFLASDYAGYITGQTLIIDGGMVY